MKMQGIVRGTAIAALVLATSAPVFAAEHNTKENRGQFSSRDYRFVIEATRGGMDEVRLGELAKQKASNPTVRDFGQRMVADHTKANNELKQIVASKGAVLPTEMTHRENSQFDRFEKLTGPEFDKEYAAHMVKDHKKDLKEFQDAANDVTDPDLKAFAQKTVSTLQEHLRMAEQMEASVK